MNDKEKRENDGERDEKINEYQRHLQVNSVGNSGSRKEADWNRKAHSSPIKGYRRNSGLETEAKVKYFTLKYSSGD